MYITLQQRLLFYNSYIRPHFEYCSVVWGNLSNLNMQKIDKLNKKLCKLILGNYNTSSESARNQLNILFFKETMFVRKAKLIQKISNNMSPVYLSELFQIRCTCIENSLNNLESNLRSMSNMN